MGTSARKRLMDWYARVRRDLPWRSTRDPWLILLSEVMLQQTRVATVIPYYQRFVERFPTPESMARASEQDVLALWAGLGYYSRARNLRRAAQAVAATGSFPTTLDGIRALPGVGEYTAAAVASIVHGAPVAAVDGNVLRVMSRLTAEQGDVRAVATRQRLGAAARKLMDIKRPGDFNQAVMELGATVCLPKKPQCALCPLRSACEARKKGIAGELPVKLARLRVETTELHLLIVEKNRRVLVRQRGEDHKRLAGFWELPERRELPDICGIARIGEFRHGITCSNFRVQVSRSTVNRTPRGYVWKSLNELARLPVTTMSKKAFRLAGLAVTKTNK